MENFTLKNPQNGDLAFQILTLENINPFVSLQRHNYYTIILIEQGTGLLKANFATYPFQDKTLCCFAPYQPYLIDNQYLISGFVINFHADFFCIYRHQNEEASKGTLFNNIFQSPCFQVNAEECQQFKSLIKQMQYEMQKTALAQQELLVLQLKIFLINAIRIKLIQSELSMEEISHNQEPRILQNLQEAIEKHFRDKHTASEYADILHTSRKTLARLVKTHFNKTLTKLISERVIIEAKRELYLTAQPIKIIAYNLGFEDEYYFSRFFKKNTGVSPQIYRDKVGFGREVLLLAIKQ